MRVPVSLLISLYGSWCHWDSFSKLRRRNNFPDLLPLHTFLHHFILADGSSCVEIQGDSQLLPADLCTQPMPHGQAAGQEFWFTGFVTEFRHHCGGRPGDRSFLPGGSKEWNRKVTLRPAVGSYVTILADCYPMQSAPGADLEHFLCGLNIKYYVVLWACHQTEKKEPIWYIFSFANLHASHSRKRILQKLRKPDNLLDGQ